MQLNKQKVQVAMIRKGMTVKDLAAKYGSTQQQIRNLIGSEQPTLRTLTKFCDALGVDPMEVIDL